MSSKKEIKKSNLLLGDSLKILEDYADNSFDHCIADPPYSISQYDSKKKIGWLSSNKIWKEEKKFFKINETWDSYTNKKYELFTYNWINKIRRVVKENGNILIFGSMHNIYLIGYILKRLNLKTINSIIWYKPNAFPNITQRMFCESTEQIIWAVNNSQKKAKNWTFNYEKIKELNIIKKCTKCKKTVFGKFNYCPYCGNSNLKEKTTQMRNLFEVPVISYKDRIHGKHPAQKPLDVIKRIIIACTKENDFILDPFMGIGSIPLTAKLLNRRYLGIEKQKKYFKIAEKRIRNSHVYKI